MEVAKRYSIAYKGLKNSTYDFDFEVDDALFAAYESKDIHGGNCHVEVTMLKNERQLDFDVEISGEVTCECDRCLDFCQVPIDYEGHLIVRLSEEEGEYDGEVMYIGENADVIINDGSIKGGYSSDGAGGIHIKDGAKVTLTDVHIKENVTGCTKQAPKYKIFVPSTASSTVLESATAKYPAFDANIKITKHT